jgi:hypothetical protein
MLRNRKRKSAPLLAAIVVMAGCASEPEPAPPPPPPPPPGVSLNQDVAQAASIYVAFLRDVGAIQAGFTDAESIQAAIRKGASYEPAQLSRGMIAYGAVLALQSPEYVQGVRAFAADPTMRQQLVDGIILDPTRATTLPGADKAAGLIIETLGKDSTAMLNIANSVEADAYTIQERNDPRRRWAIVHVANRDERLQGAKSLSSARMLPSAEDSARLFAAGNSGAGLGVDGAAVAGPYTRAVTQSLAIAALAALGAGDEAYKPNLEYLQADQTSEFCFSMSKLMLFQCLAASRPSFEDMFCVGRHVARDLATCTAQNLSPGPITIPSSADEAVATTAEQTPAPVATAATQSSASTTTMQ